MRFGDLRVAVEILSRYTDNEDVQVSAAHDTSWVGDLQGEKLREAIEMVRCHISDEAELPLDELLQLTGEREAIWFGDPTAATGQELRKTDRARLEACGWHLDEDRGLWWHLIRDIDTGFEQAAKRWLAYRDEMGRLDEGDAMVAAAATPKNPLGDVRDDEPAPAEGPPDNPLRIVGPDEDFPEPQQVLAAEDLSTAPPLHVVGERDGEADLEEHDFLPQPEAPRIDPSGYTDEFGRAGKPPPASPPEHTYIPEPLDGGAAVAKRWPALKPYDSGVLERIAKEGYGPLVNEAVAMIGRHFPDYPIQLEILPRGGGNADVVVKMRTPKVNDEFMLAWSTMLGAWIDECPDLTLQHIVFLFREPNDWNRPTNIVM